MAGVGLVSDRVSGAERSPVAGWRLLVDDSRLRYVAGLAALVGLYYGAARFGYALEFAGPVAAIVWLPVGVGIAFLYVFGVQFWPGVVVGDLLANNYSALPFGAALGQTFGNLLEVVVATVLLHRLVRRGSPLATVGGLARMVIALAAGTALSATIGSLSLRLGHVISTSALPDVWRTWWLGDWTGALLVVPLALAFYRPLHPRLWRQRWLEAALGFAAVVGLSALALYGHHPLEPLAIPALIWSALRLRQRGATLAVAVLAGFAVWATTHYVGPFQYHSLARRVLDTQLLIAAASFSALCLAAVVTEREVLAEGLWASRARLLEAADTERRRLLGDIHDGVQQSLTALIIRVRLAAEQARQDPARAESLFHGAERDLELAIDELRELAHGRHPRVLAEQGLAAAIRNLAESSAIPIKLDQLPQARLPDRTEVTAYFVLAEAITNAQKHANASSIALRAEVSHRALHVEVADDGIGGAAESNGSGLQGLRDRVEALGGTFEVSSIPGEGTRVAAEIPTGPLAP